MSEKFVKQVLEEMSFKVDKIDEGKEKSPDFFVSSKDEQYIIEVKEKKDNPEHVELAKLTKSGKFSTIEIDITQTGVIDRIISHAKKQIASYVDDSKTFRLAWFVCTGLHSSAHIETIINSLYGSVYMWDLENKYWDKTTPICYFYNHSKFFRYKNDIDAVIVGDTDSAKLCINPFSPRYDDFKNSELAKRLEEGIIDPVSEEKRKTALIADCECNRNDLDKVLLCLNKKYDTTFKPFPMKYYSGFTSV